MSSGSSSACLAGVRRMVYRNLPGMRGTDHNISPGSLCYVCHVRCATQKPHRYDGWFRAHPARTRSIDMCCWPGYENPICIIFVSLIPRHRRCHFLTNMWRHHCGIVIRGWKLKWNIYIDHLFSVGSVMVECVACWCVFVPHFVVAFFVLSVF